MAVATGRNPSFTNGRACREARRFQHLQPLMGLSGHLGWQNVAALPPQPGRYATTPRASGAT